MISRKKALLVVASLLLGATAIASCASRPSHVTDVQQMSVRLQGNWLLQSYRPSVTLDLPLQSMLAAQFGQLRVTIQGSQITAQGPGVQAVRSFQIQEVVDQTATLVVSEPTGVSVRVWIDYRGNILTFRPLEGTWSGEGTLQRLP